MKLFLALIFLSIASRFIEASGSAASGTSSIQNTQNDLKIYENYNLYLECRPNTTFELRNGTQWSWYLNEIELKNSTNPRELFITIEHPQNSTLKIFDTNSTHVGLFTCLAKENDKIVYKQEFLFVKFVGKYDSLWLFIGICIESVVLCVAVFVYEKKCAKSIDYDDDEYENSKVDTH